MSNMKYDAIVRVGHRDRRARQDSRRAVPADARVEMDAKMAAGYFTEGPIPTRGELAKAKGRGLDE